METQELKTIEDSVSGSGTTASPAETDASMRHVDFMNATLRMAGNLYLPKGFREKTGHYAAIVCVHPGGGVKEQTAGLYAQERFLVDGATHMDLYDGEGAATAVAKLAPFFARTLASSER